MKYGVWSKILADFSIKDAAHLIKDCGYDGVEWRIHDQGHIPLANVESMALEVATICDQAGIEILNLGSYLQVTQAAEFEILARAAHNMNTHQIRVWAPFYEGQATYPQLFSDTRQALATIEKLAIRYDVKAVLKCIMAPSSPVPDLPAA
jgi:sugar phosphate isomerase/epimerase